MRVSINDREIETYTVTGIVSGYNKSSKTNVYGSGNAHGVSVNSSTTTYHDFFIVTQDGTEKAIQLTNDNVILRDGQNVTLLVVKNEKGVFGCRLVNFNSKTFYSTYDTGNLLKALDIHKISYGMWYLKLPILMFFIMLLFVIITSVMSDLIKSIVNTFFLISPIVLIGDHIRRCIKKKN